MKRQIVIIGVLIFLITLSSSTSVSDNPSMPSELNVYVSGATPNAGDTVTVTISEIPYEDGGEMQFSADVYYGNKEDYTSPWNEPDYILDHWIDPSKPNGWIYNLQEGVTYTTTFSFVPEKEGKVTIDVSCHRRYDITSESIEINVLENSNIDDSSTPGFEIFILISAIIFMMRLKRK